MANPREPCDPVAPLPELPPRGMRPTAAVKERRDVLHDLAPFPSMREAPGDGQEPLAFGSSQVACDAHKAILAHGTDGLLHGGACARQAARRFLFGRGSAALHLRLGLDQALAL